jgi:hypothetical protein
MSAAHKGIVLAGLLLAACGGGGGDGSDKGAAAPQAQAAAAFSCDGYPMPGPGGFTVCEQRSFPGLPVGGEVRIETEDGAIFAHGRPGGSVDLNAFIYASALTEDQARALAAQIEIHVADGHYYATGPQEGLSPIPGVQIGLGPNSWRVDFDAAVPNRLTLAADSTSGTVQADDVHGFVTLSSTSGEVFANRLGGSVVLSTTSGDIVVDLVGVGWSGTGLDADSTSGAVTFQVPGDYRASFELSSTSGTISSDFGGTAQSEPGSENLTEHVGGGGAWLRARTTSGDIALRRK